jgi:hypothetical protein
MVHKAGLAGTAFRTSRTTACCARFSTFLAQMGVVKTQHVTALALAAHLQV